MFGSFNLFGITFLTDKVVSAHHKVPDKIDNPNDKKDRKYGLKNIIGVNKGIFYLLLTVF
jgi:hypothetical protein